MRTAIVVVALVGLLAACGGDSKPAKTGTPGTAPTGLATRAATVTPEPIGTRADGANESPVTALRRQIDYLNRGQLGEEWGELHPAQQKVVPRSKFEECIGQIQFRIDAVDVTQTRDDQINVPEVPEKAAKSITAKLFQGNDTLDRTFYEVLVDGNWHWVLDSAAIEKYKAGQCP